MIRKNKVSNVIAEVLDETYTYLVSLYEGEDIEIIKNKLLAIANIDSFDFHPNKNKKYSYENIQELLSTLNEKESIRRNKGVYYTPIDVVKFIIYNSIKSVYGKLGVSALHVMDLNGVPYSSFCLEKLILDPTCGAGEFILTALEVKFDLLDNHIDNITEDTIKKTISTIYGNDINKESTIISKIRLFLCAVCRYGVKKCLNIDKILNKNFSNKDFISKTPNLGRKFDLIIGNPPYVEDSKSGLKLSKNYGNIYANVLSNSSQLLNNNGVFGFIIPLSYVSTPRMKKIRDELFENISEQYILSYADRPDCLFKSVHQKLCILIGKNRKSNKRIYTGNYQYWYKEERGVLFDHTIATKNNYATGEFIPKLGTSTDVNIYDKVCNKKKSKPLIKLQSVGTECVYVNMRAAFWIKAFRENHSSSEYKRFTFQNTGMADYFSCLINSSLFWWYWICISDCWHITNKELQGFMVPIIENFEIASKLAGALENKLEETKLYVGTKQTEYEYKHKSCIAEINAIDDYINELFGLTEAEGLYIKNFAYRYRVGGGVE